MAGSFVIACPECGKQIKVTEEVFGKKIRCKECGTAFPVKKSSAKPVKSPASAKPAAQSAKPAPVDDEDDGNPYALAKTDDGIPRCPHCVKVLESVDARICLNCGYDLVTRTHFKTKKVYEATGEEKFKWRLPGILCVIGIVVLITVSIIVMVKTTGYMKDGLLHDNEEGKDKFIIHPGCFKLFNGLLTAFICFHLGRFAYKRLVVNNQPPERQILKDDENDEEDELEDEDDDDDDEK